MQLHSFRVADPLHGRLQDTEKNNEAQPHKGDTLSFSNENGFKRQPVEPVWSQ
jgi:hypothetical protein